MKAQLLMFTDELPLQTSIEASWHISFVKKDEAGVILNSLISPIFKSLLTPQAGLCHSWVPILKKNEGK